MHFTYSLIGAFAGLMAVSQASYFVPADTPNGHYRVHVDEHGNALGPLQQISEITSKRSAASESSLEARQFPSPSVNCNGYGINDNDFAVTTRSLNSWCDAGNVVPPYTNDLWVYQTSLAYICNYASGNNPCSSNEYNAANRLENDDCGSSNAGWVYISDWAKSYGRANSGINVC